MRFMTTNLNQTKNFITEKKRKRNRGFKFNLHGGKEHLVSSNEDFAKALVQLHFQRRERMSCLG